MPANPRHTAPARQTPAFVTFGVLLSTRELVRLTTRLAGFSGVSI
jgi:hypothetical protein